MNTQAQAQMIVDILDQFFQKGINKEGALRFLKKLDAPRSIIEVVAAYQRPEAA